MAKGMNSCSRIFLYHHPRTVSSAGRSLGPGMEQGCSYCKTNTPRTICGSICPVRLHVVPQSLDQSVSCLCFPLAFMHGEKLCGIPHPQCLFRVPKSFEQLSPAQCYLSAMFCEGSCRATYMAWEIPSWSGNDWSGARTLSAATTSRSGSRNTRTAELWESRGSIIHPKTSYACTSVSRFNECEFLYFLGMLGEERMKSQIRLIAPNIIPNNETSQLLGTAIFKWWLKQCFETNKSCSNNCLLRLIQLQSYKVSATAADRSSRLWIGNKTH